MKCYTKINKKQDQHYFDVNSNLIEDMEMDRQFCSIMADYRLQHWIEICASDLPFTN